MNEQYILDQFFDNAWRRMCGAREKDINPTLPDYNELKKSQWNPAFIKHMQQNMILGTFRYGFYKDKRQPPFNRIDSVIKRLENYKETGNLEFLPDCANLLMVEFGVSKHPKKHFRHTEGHDCHLTTRSK